jgi:hypothetical protein
MCALGSAPVELHELPVVEEAVLDLVVEVAAHLLRACVCVRVCVVCVCVCVCAYVCVHIVMQATGRMMLGVVCNSPMVHLRRRLVLPHTRMLRW